MGYSIHVVCYDLNGTPERVEGIPNYDSNIPLTDVANMFNTHFILSIRSYLKIRWTNNLNIPNPIDSYPFKFIEINPSGCLMHRLT